MSTSIRLMLCVFLLAGLTAGTGCSRGQKDVEPRLTASGDPIDPAADREEELRKVVRRQLEVAAREAGGGREEVQRYHPYWYKSYAEYPDGSDRFSVVMQETESRTTPYKADVTLSKVRYATKFHSKRDDAARDGEFFRDTGEETLAFELRHGRWVLLGSTFVAATSEQRVDGVWVPRDETTEPAFPEEGGDGWFKRVWGNITGR